MHFVSLGHSSPQVDKHPSLAVSLALQGSQCKSLDCKTFSKDQYSVITWETLWAILHVPGAQIISCLISTLNSPRGVMKISSCRGSKFNPCRCRYVCVFVAQSCPTLFDPLDCSSPGSSVHEIFQERIMELVAISSSRDSSWPRNQTRASYFTSRFFMGQVPICMWHFASKKLWVHPRLFINKWIIFLIFKIYSNF